MVANQQDEAPISPHAVAALDATIAERRASPWFREVKKRVAEDRPVLDRLADREPRSQSDK